MQQAHTLQARPPVAALGVDARATFIWRTYGHVAAAILGFGAIETYLFGSGLAEPLTRAMLGTSWLLVLGAFMIVGWLATSVAHRVESKPLQYLALAGFVVAESIIFVPLLLHRDLDRAGDHRERRRCHAARHGGAHGRRVRHAQGLLVSARHPRMGRRARAGRDRRQRPVRVCARHVVLGRDDRLRRRGSALRHLERSCITTPKTATSPLRCSCSHRSR